MEWLLVVGLVALFATAGYAWGREWYLSRPNPTAHLSVTEAEVAAAMGFTAREWVRYVPAVRFENVRALLINPDPVERWILAGGDASLEEFLEREGPTSRP